MPPKKRNASSRKHFDASPVIPSPILLQLDTPTSSAAPSPPDRVTPFNPDFISDPEPDVVREGIVDLVSDGRTVGLTRNMFRHEDERRADLSVFESQPLLPSSGMQAGYTTDVQPISSGYSDLGHVRSPVLAREPTTLETFSRMVRNYIPSSIPIPSAAPIPPHVSRPVSFGSFLNPSSASAMPSGHQFNHAEDTSYKRRGTDIVRRKEPIGWAGLPSAEGMDQAVFDLDEELTENKIPAPRYPGSDEGEAIVWSGWDRLALDENSTPRRLLMIGYVSGIQIWDCSNLGSVSEILNLSGSQWGTVEYAKVLPSPPSEDSFRSHRPLIGFLSKTSERTFVIYSLRNHAVVHRISLSSLVSFSASFDHIVLGTSQPPTLRIFSSRTFKSLYTIPSTSLVTFAQPSLSRKHNRAPLELERNASFEPNGLSLNTIPQPIYALSGRMLAYCSPPPPRDIPSASLSRFPLAGLGSAHEDGTLKLSQADFGSTAVKLGSTVLSGMKSLGGMAFSAARAGVSAAIAGDTTTSTRPSAPSRDSSNTFFSRSAPASSGHEAQFSPISADSPVIPQASSWETGSQTRLKSSSNTMPSVPRGDAGSYITVLDLATLQLESAMGSPAHVAEFPTSKQPICNITFSDDGTTLITSPKDGQVVRVFQLRPAPRTVWNLERTAEEDRTSSELPYGPPWHMYDLRRGRTSGIIENVAQASDGRWLAVGTRKGTIHIFATNPYGGPSDERSHLEGRVANPHKLQPLSTELTPVTRIRASKIPSYEQRAIAPTFTFLGSSRRFMPPSLLPNSNRVLAPTGSTSGSSSQQIHHRSTPISPSKHSKEPTNFQDVLVFDSFDGTMSLHRIYLEKRVPEQTASAVNPSASTSPYRPSGLTRIMEKSTELLGRESVVATWVLRRGLEWKDVKHPLVGDIQTATQEQSKREDRNWLSQAELSTSSRSPDVLPRSIYLSHQFSFHTIGEDYHGLIRTHRFDIPSTKVDVRKEVEVSTFNAGVGESFVQGTSAARDRSAISTSFDEPLASAISAEMNHSNPSPPVIPMYPNGTPSSLTRSLRNSVPIRNVAVGLGDGVSEGLGRIRREIVKVRSPRLGPKGDSSMAVAVPLEFDEEDEDFLVHDSSLQDPAGRLIPQDVTRDLFGEDEDLIQSWDIEDKQAIEDREQFDDISAVGFMDEELSGR